MNDYVVGFTIKKNSAHRVSVDEVIWTDIESSRYETIRGSAAKSVGWAYGSEDFCDTNGLIPTIPSGWVDGTSSVLLSDEVLVAICYPEWVYDDFVLPAAKKHNFRIERNEYDGNYLSQKGWINLGIDVADLIQISLIAHSPHSKIKDFVEGKLNKYGLLSDIKYAISVGELAVQLNLDHQNSVPTVLYASAAVRSIKL